MKRFICLIIALIVLCNMSFFVNADILVAENDDETYKLLSAIGIFDNSDLSLLGSSNYVKRSEFVDYVVRMIKGENISFDETKLIADVSKESAYYKSVMIAYNLGIISKNTVAFEPDRAITYTEAVTMILRALGYGEACDNKNGYPIGYISTALEIDLMDGIDCDMAAGLKYNGLSKLIYNAVNAPLLNAEYFSDSYTEYKKNKERNILSEYYDVYKQEGVVSANEFTALSLYDSYYTGCIEINGNKYLISDGLYNEYLGYYVTLFYKDNKGVATDEAICILENDNNVKNILHKDVNTYQDGKIIYYDENGREKSISVNKDTKYIYNDKVIDYDKDFSSELFEIKNGLITAIDNNQDSKFDVVKISEYSGNVVYSSYNEDWQTVCDLSFANNNISLKDKEYSIITENGKLISFANVSFGDVLTVFESKDKSYVKFVVSYKRFTGAVDAMNKQSGVLNDEIYIGDEVFDIAKNMNLDDKIKLGAKGTFYLNNFNEIIYFEEAIDSEGSFALLKYIERDTDDPKNILAAILEQSKEETVLSLADRVILNGSSTKELEVIGKICDSNGDFTPTAVFYKVNEDKEITFLDTPANSKSEAEVGISLIKIRNKTDDKLKYKSQNKSFGMFYYPNAAGVIQFGVPLDDLGEVQWDYAEPVTLKNDASNNVELYAMTDKDETMLYNVAIAFGVSGEEAEISAQQALCIITDIRNVVYEDEQHLAITMNVANNEETYYVAEGCENILNGIEEGDIIRYGLDNAGFVREIELQYDYSLDIFPQDPGTGTITIYDRNLFCYGTVYNCEDDYVTMRLNNDTSGIMPYTFALKNSLIYSVNKRTGEVSVKVPTSEDVKDFTRYGTNTQKVIMHSRSGLTYSSVPSIIIDR